LHWVRRAISLRKQHSVFGRGSFEFIKPDNRKIFAFTRSYHDETVICVYNLSRSSQPVELDLSHYEGYAPVEMFGQARFPRIEQKPYQLALNEYGFFWLLIHKGVPSSEDRALQISSIPPRMHRCVRRASRQPSRPSSRIGSTSERLGGRAG
jgi:maltose alpha-D-glucosyltransferase / alpha-amylase